MIALAVVLWKMANNNSPEKTPPPQISYSDFMANVDRGNIKSTRLLESPATAEIQGQLREPARDFTVTIPKEVIPDLTEKLRKQDASLDVSESTSKKTASWPETLINFSPVLLIVALWIFMMKQQQKRRNPPQAGNPPNGPLG